MHRTIKLFVATTLLLALAACSEKTSTPAESQATLADATSAEAMEAIRQDVAKAALPKADKSTPLERYLELTNGNQIMFSYLALAKMPIDYNEIAGTYSRDYANTSDEFRRNDLLGALKPRIDDEVAKAGAARYIRLTIDNPISKYDFEKKGFPLESTLWEPGSYRYFHDNSAYRLGFSNGDAFRYLNVPDEASARAIESARSQRQDLQLRIYGFAQDADITEKTVKAEIVRVALVDAKGHVLATN